MKKEPATSGPISLVYTLFKYIAANNIGMANEYSYGNIYFEMSWLGSFNKPSEAHRLVHVSGSPECGVHEDSLCSHSDIYHCNSYCHPLSMR